MGLFSFLFGSSKAAESTVIKENDNLPEIKREDFVDDSDPEKDDGIIRIAYGTGRAIDLIYAFLDKDYESKGYDDALCNPDSSYKEMNVKGIKSKFYVMLKRIITKYDDDLRQVEFHIDSRRQLGLIDLVKQLESEKDTLKSHKELLLEMRAGSEEENLDPLINILTSYERGFLRGLAAKTIETLNLH
ncbi:MAG: hypothetical protein LBN29_11560 [Mediterranea sp.]|jgi:hypothetical protein|nr:hypothetical protein [Mediterranea sp.]